MNKVEVEKICNASEIDILGEFLKSYLRCESIILLTLNKDRSAKNYLLCDSEKDAEAMLEVALDSFLANKKKS